MVLVSHFASGLDEVILLLAIIWSYMIILIKTIIFWFHCSSDSAVQHCQYLTEDIARQEEITRLHKNISGSQESSFSTNSPRNCVTLVGLYNYDGPSENCPCKIFHFWAIATLAILDLAKPWVVSSCLQKWTRQLHMVNPSQDTSATDALVTIWSQGPETCLEWKINSEPQF